MNLIACKFHTCNAYTMLISDVDCFILSPQFAALYRRHGELSLNTLHQSLNIEDRVAALIWKQKLLTYSEGSSLASKHALSLFSAYAKRMLNQVFYGNIRLTACEIVMNSEFAKFTFLIKSIFLSYAIHMHKQKHLYRCNVWRWIFHLKWFREVQMYSQFSTGMKMLNVSWTYTRHM